MGLDVVVLRFASTYGPGKTARHGKMGVMSQIVENPANGLPFHLAQGGDKKDDFVYNKDSAHGIYLATIAAQPKSRVYNIGTGVGVTLNDFARVIRQHLPQARIEIGPGLNVSRHTSAGLHSLAPAAKSRTPWRRSAARLRGAGLPSARPAYTGMGLASLEYPRYRHHALKADQGALEAIGDEFRPGMVFAFNIDLFDPKWRNGETGCVFAETIRITERGACRMHGYPTELQVLDV
jgi:hypothetical protein